MKILNLISLIIFALGIIVAFFIPVFITLGDEVPEDVNPGAFMLFGLFMMFVGGNGMSLTGG